MTRKDVKNIKQMHSKRTGAIILIVLGFLIVGGSIFMYLVIDENNKFEIELQSFLALSCEEMKQDIINFEPWQHEAYTLKQRAGEC